MLHNLHDLHGRWCELCFVPTAEKAALLNEFSCPLQVFTTIQNAKGVVQSFPDAPGEQYHLL